MAAQRFSTRVLNPGRAAGEALVLDEPLSFWGGFDPATGTVIDPHHPQAGIGLAGKVLVLPESRGSAGTPAGVAEALRRATGPVAVILAGTDVNIAVGAMVADRLYETGTPVVVLTSEDYAQLRSGMRIAVDPDGIVTIDK